MSGEKHRIPLISIAMILIGVAVLSCEIWHHNRENGTASQKWLQAGGTIIMATVTSLGKSGSGKDDAGFTPSFQYRYIVDGKEYLGEKISQRIVVYRDEKSAQEFVKEFPAGQDVTVYYEKNNPSSALLELPVHQINKLYVGLAVLLTIAGLIVWRFLRI